jgi:hypothetical protein
VDECVDTARTYARIRDITIDVERRALERARPPRPPGSRDLEPAHQRREVHAEGGRILVRTSDGSVS